MSESADQASTPDADEPEGDEAPAAHELEDSEQRGGDAGTPPMEVDSFQGSGMPDDDRTIDRGRRRDP